jgi:hypothetical protein
LAVAAGRLALEVRFTNFLGRTHGSPQQELRPYLWYWLVAVVVLAAAEATLLVVERWPIEIM